MKGRPKGQIALEAVIILLILLVVYTTLIYPLHRMSNDSVDDLREVYLAEQTVANVVNGVNLVGASGYGAMKVMKIHIPGNTSFSCSMDGEVRIRFNLTNGSIISTGGVQMGLNYERKCEIDPLPPAMEAKCYLEINGTADFGIFYKDNTNNNACDYQVTRPLSESGRTVYFCFENLGERGVNLSIGDTPECSGIG